MQIKHLIIILFSFPHTIFCQKLREIIITKDTVREYYKHSGIIEEPYIENGILINTVDSINKIQVVATYVDNKLNGDYFAFFIDVNMLEIKGSYKENMKNGKWFYWNKEGLLLKTEVWKDDKLISNKKYLNKKQK